MTSTLLFPSEPLPLEAARILAEECPLLAPLGFAAVEQLIPYLERVHAKPQTILAHEGTEPRGLFLILAGTARLCRSGLDLGKLGKGGHFGSLGPQTKARNHASLIADSAMELGWLRRERYAAMVQDNPTLALPVREVLSGALAQDFLAMTANVGFVPVDSA